MMKMYRGTLQAWKKSPPNLPAGIKLLEKAFSTDEYSDEDLQYVAGVLQFISAKTIWRTFESCNNYKMPQIVHTDSSRIEYWFSETEEKDRKWDIRYMRKHFPMTKFRRLFGVGHGGLAALQPKRLMRGLERVMNGALFDRMSC